MGRSRSWSGCCPHGSSPRQRVGAKAAGGTAQQPLTPSSLASGGSSAAGADGMHSADGGGSVRVRARAVALFRGHSSLLVGGLCWLCARSTRATMMNRVAQVDLDGSPAAEVAGGRAKCPKH